MTQNGTAAEQKQPRNSVRTVWRDLAVVWLGERDDEGNSATQNGTAAEQRAGVLAR